jgi:hypothetical protein
MSDAPGEEIEDEVISQKLFGVVVAGHGSPRVDEPEARQRRRPIVEAGSFDNLAQGVKAAGTAHTRKP